MSGVVISENKKKMNKKGIIILGFLLIGLFLMICDFPISETKIVGLYVNNNFDEEPFYAETPYIKDTLNLNADKTFTSKYYGIGTYELKSGFFKNELYISYEMGKSVHIFHLRNRLFQSMKIMLVHDLDYYYEKVM